MLQHIYAAIINALAKHAQGLLRYVLCSDTAALFTIIADY